MIIYDFFQKKLNMKLRKHTNIYNGNSYFTSFISCQMAYKI